MTIMDLDQIMLRDWKSLSRGEIISRLQYLPYHDPQARALRAAFSMLEQQNKKSPG